MGKVAQGNIALRACVCRERLLGISGGASIGPGAPLTFFNILFI